MENQQKGTDTNGTPDTPTWCRRQISAKCTIEAPVDRVWEIMSKVEDYGKWNPFIVQVDTGNSSTFTEGERVLIHVRMNESSSKLTKTWLLVTDVSPPSGTNKPDGELKYVFDDRFLASPGIVKSTRIQRIRPINSNQCEYTTTEFFGGYLWRFVPYDQVQKGFDIHASSLKVAAEQG